LSTTLAVPIVPSATVAVFIPAPNINPKKLSPAAGAVVKVMVLAAIV